MGGKTRLLIRWRYRRWWRYRHQVLADMDRQLADSLRSSTADNPCGDFQVAIDDKRRERSERSVVNPSQTLESVCSGPNSAGGSIYLRYGIIMGLQIVNKPPTVRAPMPLGEWRGSNYTGWSFGCPVCDRSVRIKHTPGIVDVIETCGDHTFRVHWCDDCPTCGT